MTVEHQPLYAQVKALLVQRIGSGAWKPGEMLPNEFDLASEYKVSQGTIRKALTALEGDRLIVRRQGRGTYVARHTGRDTLFQFFRMVGLDGRRLEPVSVVLTQDVRRATPEQAAQLGVEPGSELHAILRTRQLDGSSTILESIFVPVAYMPDLRTELGAVMQDEMYVLYQERFGVTVARACERLRAIAADEEAARHLAIEVGAPLMEIVRVAHDVNGRPVELRVSQCNTDRALYAADIS